MRKNKKYILIISLFFTYFFGIINVNAASVSVSSTSNNVIVGNKIKVTINISDDVAAWDFSVGYDTSKLRVDKSDLENGMRSASTSSLHSREYTITFKAIASGKANVYISDAALYADNYSALSVSKGSKTFTLKTQAEIEASYSKNNYLSSLSIEGRELLPGFNRDVMEYNVELEPETTSINVIASVADSTASINGAGPREVTDGDNRIEVVVTAQNGTTRTYVINANVKEYDPITVKIGNKDYTVVRKKSALTPPNNYKETTVKINDTDVPAYQSEVTGYTLVALKDSEGKQDFYVYKNDTYTLYKEYKFNGIILYPMEIKESELPKNYKETTITYNDEEIIAYKIKKSSKYALLYAMNIETGSTDLYMYDAKEDTVQIYNTEEIEILEEQATLFTKIAMGLGVLSTVLFGIIIAILVKNKKKNKITENK